MKFDKNYKIPDKKLRITKGQRGKITHEYVDDPGAAKDTIRPEPVDGPRWKNGERVRPRVDTSAGDETVQISTPKKQAEPKPEPRKEKKD